MNIRGFRQRLKKLERSPMFQRAADPVDPARALALREISNEDLALLIDLGTDHEAGLCRPPSQQESAAVAALEAAFARHGARYES
jgi:hypothetical protein